MQTALPLTFEEAARLQYRLINEYARKRDRRMLAKQMFTLRHRDGWTTDPGIGQNVPYEYSTVRVKIAGEVGIPPEVIETVGAMGLGLSEAGKESPDGITVSLYDVSSYSDPGWSWPNPRTSVDPTRPDEIRDPEIERWLDDPPTPDWYDPFEPQPVA